jgi:replicative DNA helicase
MTQQSDLPHDFLSEKALIGSLLIDNRAFDEITDIQLSLEDFYHPQYGVIFDAINDLAVSSEPFDLISVCAKLTDMGKLEAVGGQSALIFIIILKLLKINQLYVKLFVTR